MNAKKAKKLRRLAESVSAGLPIADYQATGPGHYVGPRSNPQWMPDPIQLKPRCTRAVYHVLKRRANE